MAGKGVCSVERERRASFCSSGGDMLNCLLGSSNRKENEYFPPAF